SGSVVTGYVVQWQRDTSIVCPDLRDDRDDGSVTVASSSFTGHTITGLEPGNRYTITVTVSNGAGSGPVSNAVAAMITATAPSGPPGPITLVTVTPNSAIVQWGEVLCLQRNGEITDYTVTATNSDGMEEGTASVDVDARRATISGLTPSTQYTVSVAAVNSAGTGPSTTLPVETPDGLTVSATPSSSTSLTISWTLEDSLTATSYTISYYNTNTDCFTHSRSGISASGTSYTLDGLEEGTEYSITVTATLTGNGGTQEGSTTATTLTAAPSAPPTGVVVRVESSTSITVQWGPVECRHQNGEITGYWARYGEEGSSEVQMVSGDSSGGMTTVSGLTKEIVYTVQVAAVTSSGTGAYSDP
ncbi:Receptor-type tyrosine-protein phosphatase delta, partial [Geodia barretti]